MLHACMGGGGMVSGCHVVNVVTRSPWHRQPHVTKADIYVTVGHIWPGLGLSLLPDMGSPPGIDSIILELKKFYIF